MAIRAVLFDYSGTLFRLEEDDTWVSDLVDADGKQFDIHQQAEIMRRMTTPSGQVVDMDAAGKHAWHNRDLDPAMHRKAYLDVLLRSGVPTLEQAEALYRRTIDPMEWTPYPDAGTVLKKLAADGIGTAVVSNIAFDIRPAFVSNGLDSYVTEMVLSYEVGAIKPDPEIFRFALDRLGVDPADALMIGDSAEADGGAAALGCAFVLVEALPTRDRPDALLRAVADTQA